MLRLILLWIVSIKILPILVGSLGALVNEEEAKRIEMPTTVTSSKMKMEIYAAKNLFFLGLSTKKVKDQAQSNLKKRQSKILTISQGSILLLLVTLLLTTSSLKRCFNLNTQRKFWALKL